MAVTTKRYILDQAFDEIGLSGYAFNLSGNDLIAALRKLDALVATWEASGLSIGWVFSSNPDNSDPDDEITVPDASLQALATALAIRLAPSYGKQLSQDTKIAAANGLNALRTATQTIPQQQLPSNLPIGAGNKTVYQKYFAHDDTLNSNGGALSL